ncbi:MAG: hypothetical protein RLZZ385_748 [Pseudomonadota bacterium]|jgi:DNA replication and repair protein RecF
MTTISKLNITRLRNIDQLSLLPGELINVISGPNGSGKTSILEAIYLLGVGRSFRSAKVAPLIQEGSKDCTVFCELDGGAVAMGLQKSRLQKPILKLQGNKQPNWIEAAKLLPLQILDANTFLLLEGSPKVRRRFLDWGVFHVEPSFVDHWRNSRVCIANRNQLLKGKSLDRSQLAAWDSEFGREAAHIDSARSVYFEAFQQVLAEVLREIAPESPAILSYFRGWDPGLDLTTVLSGNLDSDRRYGLTQAGPHRADIQIRVGKLNAAEVLSRGQQKMLVSAMKIAQAILLARSTSRTCVFLIDDLPAELDEKNRATVCRYLARLDSQVFITCVDERSLQHCWDAGIAIRKFHVEHGKIHP